jgi:hypothetical protein
MTSHPIRRRQLPTGPFTVFKPGVLGPRRRPLKGGREPQVCVCGLQFLVYWAHRQTGHHKRHVQADLIAVRVERRLAERRRREGRAA